MAVTGEGSARGTKSELKRPIPWGEAIARDEQVSGLSLNCAIFGEHSSQSERKLLLRSVRDLEQLTPNWRLLPLSKVNHRTEQAKGLG